MNIKYPVEITKKLIGRDNDIILTFKSEDTILFHYHINDDKKHSIVLTDNSKKNGYTIDLFVRYNVVFKFVYI